MNIEYAQNKVSIIILVHNALDFVKVTLNSLRLTSYPSYEIIVVDNASNTNVVTYLKKAKKIGLVHKLFLSHENTYFAKGNNMGSKLVAKDSKYILLLNSDIRIESNEWLSNLINRKEDAGAISYGCVDYPVLRPDGWCFLIDKDIYFKYGGLDEYYQFWWSITDLTIKMLEDNLKLKAIRSTTEYITHFGGKSMEKSIDLLKFNNIKLESVVDRFAGYKVEEL